MGPPLHGNNAWAYVRRDLRGYTGCYKAQTDRAVYDTQPLERRCIMIRRAVASMWKCPTAGRESQSENSYLSGAGTSKLDSKRADYSYCNCKLNAIRWKMNNTRAASATAAW